MAFRPFLGWTIAGGVAWPVLHGMFAYALGNTARQLSGPLQVALGVATLTVVVAVLRFVKRNEMRLEEIAMRSDSYEKPA
jgi:membrane protein DedA with SNARE-associated domain